MELIDNVRHLLKDDLTDELQPHANLSIAAASFSMYAFNELKKQLEGIDSLRFIFTSPTFTTEKTPKEKREFYILRLDRERAVCGSEFEIKLRNEMTQQAVARECADWIRKKASFKSNRMQSGIQGFIYVQKETPAAYTPLNGFTTVDLGCSRGNTLSSFITKIDYPETEQLLKTFDNLWNDADLLQDVTDQVLSCISSAYSENSPEFIYFVTLYNIFTEFLDDKRFLCRGHDTPDAELATAFNRETHDGRNMHYDLIDPKTGNHYKPNYNRVWAYIPESMQKLLDENRVIFPRDAEKRPMLKRFASELNLSVDPFSTWISDVGLNTEGTRAVYRIFDNMNLFNYAKPISLIEKIIGQVLNNNDIILDFFSGSATTAHAVMQLNAEDGGTRKFIMVQLPEECDEQSEAYKAGYKTICDIGKERIRRAGDKINAELRMHNDESKKKNDPQLSLTASDADNFELSITHSELDIGFRVFKVDDSNMKDVYYSAEETSQQMLSGLESNIKEDRTDMDLLYGCLLDWGLPLSLPHTSETLDGVTVHTVNNGALIACFDADIPESAIRTIAQRKPLRAVFRDSSFATSPEKINVTEIFKTISPNTGVKVI